MIDLTRRRGRRCQQLVGKLKYKRGYSKLKEEALDRTLWGTRFGKGYGPAVRQTTEWMNEWMDDWMNKWTAYFVKPLASIFSPVAQQALMIDGLIIKATRSYSDTPHSVGLLWTSDQPHAAISDNTQHSQQTDIHALCNPCKWRAANPHLRLRGYWVRLFRIVALYNRLRLLSSSALPIYHRQLTYNLFYAV